MRIISLVFALLLVGCTSQPASPKIIVKVIEKNITIPEQYFEIPEVLPVIYEPNGTNSYKEGYLSIKGFDGIDKHLVDLYTAHKACVKRLDTLKKLYSDENLSLEP